MPNESPMLNGSVSEVASLFQELDNAERTADALEGRLSTLEKRLDELLQILEGTVQSVKEEDPVSGANSSQREA